MSIVSVSTAIFAEAEEAFKLHLGLISEVKRKSLPAIAQVAGLDNAIVASFSHRTPWQIPFSTTSPEAD